eukprot:SAG25_NODE_398_length_8498_cov_16.527206_5_plen_105_part_00
MRTHGGGGHLLLAGKEAGACVVADSRQNREHGAIYGAAVPRVISCVVMKMASFDATTAVFLFPLGLVAGQDRRGGSFRLPICVVRRMIVNVRDGKRGARTTFGG